MSEPQPASGPAASAAPIRVAIIEDQPQIREGLAVLIGGTEGFRCTARFASMEEALGRIGDDPPDVALVDIGLPGISGIEGIPLLLQRLPRIQLLVLTVYDDDERIFRALCAGASGYLLKKTPPVRLLECVREAAAGGAPMSPDVARRVVELFRRHPPPREADHGLSPHELRILRLLVEGHNYRTAAAELGVSVNTVHFHVKRIYEKLHVHSKSEAVSKALRAGLVR